MIVDLSKQLFIIHDAAAFDVVIDLDGDIRLLHLVLHLCEKLLPTDDRLDATAFDQINDALLLLPGKDSFAFFEQREHLVVFEIAGLFADNAAHMVAVLPEQVFTINVPDAIGASPDALAEELRQLFTKASPRVAELLQYAVLRPKLFVKVCITGCNLVIPRCGALRICIHLSDDILCACSCIIGLSRNPGRRFGQSSLLG